MRKIYLLVFGEDLFLYSHPEYDGKYLFFLE